MAAFDFIRKGIKGLGNFFISSSSFLGGLFGELFARFVGIPGFILDILGLRLTKHLRIRFIILSDENGGQLVPKENVLETFKRTQKIFKEQAKIKVHNAGTLMVPSAPSGALDIPDFSGNKVQQWAAEGAFMSSSAGVYLSSLAGIGPFTRRISVIVVRSIEGDDIAGWSFGASANFVAIQQSTFSDPKEQSTLAAHEIGHSCWISHRDQKINLMHKHGDRGEKLTWWQSNVVRGSRFVWYW